MTDEPLFDASLKKKSKKKNIDFAAELDAELEKDKEENKAPAPAPAAEESVTAAAAATPNAEEKPAENKSDEAKDGEDLFGGMKKKSKSKKKFDLDLDLDEPVEAAPSKDSIPSSIKAETQESLSSVGGLDEDFSEMKKKKKSKSKKAAFDLDAFEKDLKSAGGDGGDGTSTPAGKAEEDGEEGDYKPDGDLGDDPFSANDQDERAAGEEKEFKQDWLGSDRDYTYQELLGRIFSTLRAQNPALSSDRKKYTIVPPQVAREGSKKTMFANISDICRRMHRQPEHVIQFLFAELGTMGSIDGAGRLVIRGRFQPKQIENVLRRYIVEYVTCKTCKSPSTLLTKENRIYFMTCESCGSQRSVSAIKAGFQAQVGKRSKNKAT